MAGAPIGGEEGITLWPVACVRNACHFRARAFAVRAAAARGPHVPRGNPGRRGAATGDTCRCSHASHSPSPLDPTNKLAIPNQPLCCRALHHASTRLRLG